jgi:hypothetical protein
MTPLLLAIAAASATTLAGAAFGAALPTDAPNQQPVPQQQAPATALSAEIMVLHGTNNGSGIDPKIGKMPALSKPPFSAYNSYKLLDRSKQQLDQGKSGSLKLPTGRDLLVTYKSVIAPTKAGDPPRYVISASIPSVLPNVDFNAKAGEWFFVGGPSYNGGGLVIGIKVN